MGWGISSEERDSDPTTTRLRKRVEGYCPTQDSNPQRLDGESRSLTTQSQRALFLIVPSANGDKNKKNKIYN